MAKSLAQRIDVLGNRLEKEAASLAELVRALCLAREKMPNQEKAVSESEIGGLQCFQREANFLVGVLYMSQEEVIKTGEEVKASLAGSIWNLEEPNRADDDWEEAQGKYIKLMWDYIHSFKEVHRTHKIMMDFYKKEIEPRRDALLCESGIKPSEGEASSN